MNHKKALSILILLICFYSKASAQRFSETVYFMSGDIKLEGILVRPDTSKVLPVVVFQQGSGNHSFAGYETEAWGPHKFYIEDILLEQGYAVLYCNKRGLGGSEGNWKYNDFYGRSEDAYAAFQFLKEQTYIDSTRIGISGHSQGGWVAQLAAANHPEFAFVLSLAGPTVGVTEQTLSHDRFMYECKGITGEQLEKKMAKRAKKRRSNAKAGKTLRFIGGAYYWYLISEYDHTPALQNNHRPTLLLFAEFDTNVNPDQNIARINEVFEGDIPSNYTIKTMPGGQHGFYQVADQCVDWETAMQQPFDSKFRDEVSRWLKEIEVRQPQAKY